VDTTGSPTPAFITLMQNVTQGLSNASNASMPAPATVNLFADYTGAYLTGQLPRVVQVQRFSGSTDVSAKTRWFLTVDSGTISATIDQMGIITITSLTTNSVLLVKSVRDGVTLTCNVSVNRVEGQTPGTTSGVQSATTFNDVNSTTHSPITAELTVTVGGSGNVSLAAPLTVSTGQYAPVGTFPVFGKWQWFDGALWQDVAAEVQSSPDCYVNSEPDGSGVFYDVNNGRLTVNTTKTGLTVGSSQKFRLEARNGSGTRTMTFTGTASATP
jgi:hypothetical protein